jgi:glycosyltransferase domain-containing protein
VFLKLTSDFAEAGYEMSLTIVLTLKGRDDFTFRWMKYMNAVECPYRILIADGGENSDLESHLMNYENYPNLNYAYLRYPHDSTLADFYNKFVDVLSKVETSYVLLADNDDFYLLDRVPGIISFLDDNTDYVGARGLLVNIEVFSKEGESKAQVIGKSYTSHLIYAPSIDSETSAKRIETLCKGFSIFDYYSNWYSVVRTNTLLNIWKQLITIPSKEVIVLEVLTHIMIVNEGKIKIFEHPFYIRQSNTSTFGDTLVIDNEFLERCLINGSLNGFSFAIDTFVNVKNTSDRDFILRMIAIWLDVFLFNIRIQNLKKKTASYKIKSWIKSKKILGGLARFVDIHLVKALSQGKKRNDLRISKIEPFILESNRMG